MLKRFAMSMVMVLPLFAQAASPSFLTLDELLNLKTSAEQYSDEMAQIRFDAMRDEAVNSGLENGYQYEIMMLEEIILNNESVMDSLLPFNSVMSANADLNQTKAAYLVPGIIDEAENVAFINPNNREIRKDKRNIHLRSQPRVTLSPVSWRDYVFDQEVYELVPPSKALLPQTKEEEALYKKWIKEGWQMGQEQARYEMKDRLIRAFVDLAGMYRYVNEFENGRLRRPEMLVQNQAVINHGSEMAIDATFIQMMGSAAFVSDTTQWGGRYLDNRGSVRKELQTAINHGELTIQEIEEAINRVSENP